jgi:putative phosphoesterase
MKMGFLSDAHGNSVAFVQAINHMRKLGVDRFYFLGDALGYIPNVGVLDEIKKLGEDITCIKGNHEDLIIKKEYDEKKEKIYQHRLIQKLLTNEQRIEIANWPDKLVIKYKNFKMLLVHGGPKDYINQYVYEDTDINVDDIKEDIIFIGHTHCPFRKKVNQKTLVNIGSCGMPRDDGRFGSFAVFDASQGEVNLYRFKLPETLHYLASIDHGVDESVVKLFYRRKDNLLVKNFKWI